MSNKASQSKSPLALVPDRAFVRRPPLPKYRKKLRPRTRLLITDRRTAVICEAVKAGCGPKLSASLAGVSHKTVEEWVRKGEDLGTEPYATFARKYHAAEDELQASLIMGIREQARVDWRAAARMLAMRWPEEYAMNRVPQTQVNVSMGDVVVQGAEAVRERLLAMAEREALPEAVDAEVVEES